MKYFAPGHFIFGPGNLHARVKWTEVRQTPHVANDNFPGRGRRLYSFFDYLEEIISAREVSRNGIDYNSVKGARLDFAEVVGGPHKEPHARRIKPNVSQAAFQSIYCRSRKIGANVPCRARRQLISDESRTAA